MTRSPGGSLSALARELLRAERSASEPETLRQRALANARLSLEIERQSRLEMRSARPLAPMLHGRPRVRVALAAAAALAVAGMAAASVSWWQTPESVRPAQPVVGKVREFPRPAIPARSAAPRAETTTQISPLPAPSLRLAAPPSSAAPEATKPPLARQYAMELSVLEPARSAIARSDYAGALASAARHQREFPNGLLAEERSALRVRALWGLGRTTEAGVEATAFRQRYPRSALLAWMKQKQNP
jgi:hypothetical protein